MIHLFKGLVGHADTASMRMLEKTKKFVAMSRQAAHMLMNGS